MLSARVLAKEEDRREMAGAACRAMTKAMMGSWLQACVWVYGITIRVTTGVAFARIISWGPVPVTSAALVTAAESLKERGGYVWGRTCLPSTRSTKKHRIDREGSCLPCLMILIWARAKTIGL